MKKILALTTINDMTAFREAVSHIRGEYGEIVAVKKVYFDEYENPDISSDKLKEEIDTSEIVLIDIRGDNRLSRELHHLLETKDKTVVVLVASDQNIWKLTKMGKFRGEMIFKGEEKEFNLQTFLKVKKFSELTEKLGKILPFGTLKDMRNWILAQQYYNEGDTENIKNLILLLLKEYAGVKGINKIPPPQTFEYGIYLPKIGFFYDIDEFKKALPYNPENPTVGVLMYGGMHFNECKAMADLIFEYLHNDVNLIFIVSKVQYNIKALFKYLKNLKVDLLLNLQYFRIHGGPYGGDPEPTYELLRELDVPLLIGLRSSSTDLEKWRLSNEGLNPIEIVIGVTLPELDGAIEPVFISGLEGFSDPFMGKVKEPKALEDRVEKLAKRIKNWINLRKIPNEKKRIAILTYNYPPGEENLASAGYLDVFESLRIFLEKLKERGFCLEKSVNDVKELFLSNTIINTPKYLDKTPEIKIPLSKYILWFNNLPESVQKNVMKHWGKPPGNIMVDNEGNILIPGVVIGNIFIGVQPSRGVHEDIDKAYHDRDLPPHHQYLAYYFFLEKEFQAHAIIHFGMHGTLEFTKGKEIALSSECFPDILIGNLPNIYYYWIGNPSESTIAKRRSYALCISHKSPPMKTSGLYEKYIILDDLLNQYEDNPDEKTSEVIKEIATELHLSSDISELRRELYRMKRRLIPYGLHVMDKKFSEEEIIDYLLGVLRIDREFPSILKLLANHRGLDWDKVKETKLANEIENQAKEVINDLLKNNQPKELPKEYLTYIRTIVESIYKSSESEAILRALEGRYILPARAGDPIRDPEVYPSGRGMYAFDPRLIPTVAAEVRGKKSANLLIEFYLKKYGKYPESVGIVLWGFETMKTGGDTIATILHLLGVRIKHKKNPWLKELEVISLEELGRPRIDVLITICGIFRDTFGTHIDLINRAIKMVSELNEPPEKNFVRKHFLQLKDNLDDYALARIFGPSPTEYATSMRTLVESSIWKDESDLVKSYEESMSYAYFKGKIEKNEKAFSNLIQLIDIVTQERDNTEYEVTDLDHYYEFLGGLSRTVQDKKGQKADIMVIDSTEEDVVAEDLKLSIERAVRTRILNPKWIEGMLRHDFHGAKKIKDRVEYILGFAATTGKVENWIFDDIADKFIFNDEMRSKLYQNNPYATMKMAELLFESAKRGYWRADEEKVNRLLSLIMTAEEDIMDDDKVFKLD